MKYWLLFALLLSVILVSNVEASHPHTKDFHGMCYHVVQGQEGENQYFVECDEDNTAIGFNEPNCILLNGKWTKEPESCELEEIIFLHPEGEDKLYHIEKEKPKGISI